VTFYLNLTVGQLLRPAIFHILEYSVVIVSVRDILRDRMLGTGFSLPRDPISGPMARPA